MLIKGPSGQGKTTLLHLMAGLFLPAEGHVEVGGTRLTSLSDDERGVFRRRHMGLIFQRLNLINHLTALENIELGLQVKTDLRKAQQSLRSVGLQGRENERTSVLSLGEQQRVAIARVLTSEPQIILADEPTSSLDEKNASDVMDLLFEACDGKTLIVVSHDHRIEKRFSSVRDFGTLLS